MSWQKPLARYRIDPGLAAPHIDVATLGQTFVDWLISPEGQKAIHDYKIGGKQLFFPNANQSALSRDRLRAIRSARCRERKAAGRTLPPGRLSRPA
jgi:hypothetical protein